MCNKTNDSSFIDDKLISMIKTLQIASRLRTSLDIKLADYASQMLGYRSTRHVKGDDRDNVEDVFIELTNILIYSTNECLNYLESEHTYNNTILSLDELSLEIYLENTLYDCVVNDDSRIFIERFYS